MPRFLESGTTVQVVHTDERGLNSVARHEQPVVAHDDAIRLATTFTDIFRGFRRTRPGVIEIA